MSCGVRRGGAALPTGLDLQTTTLIEGVVRRGQDEIEGAYVRLLDAGGEFTAEVPTDAGGAFRFFAAPGHWTVRTLAPGEKPADRRVVASAGATTTLEVELERVG